MNGTACFIAAATMFIAQMNNISLELSDYFAVLYVYRLVIIYSFIIYLLTLIHKLCHFSVSSRSEEKRTRFPRKFIHFST